MKVSWDTVPPAPALTDHRELPCKAAEGRCRSPLSLLHPQEKQTTVLETRSNAKQTPAGSEASAQIVPPRRGWAQLPPAPLHLAQGPHPTPGDPTWATNELGGASARDLWGGCLSLSPCRQMQLAGKPQLSLVTTLKMQLLGSCSGSGGTGALQNHLHLPAVSAGLK